MFAPKTVFACSYPMDTIVKESNNNLSNLSLKTLLQLSRLLCIEAW